MLTTIICSTLNEQLTDIKHLLCTAGLQCLSFSKITLLQKSLISYYYQIRLYRTQGMLMQMMQRSQLAAGYHPTRFMLSNSILITVPFWKISNPNFIPDLSQARTKLSLEAA